MSDKRVLVTGSARGIGKAIAQKLAGSGWKVALHYTAAKDDAKAVQASLGEAAAGLYKIDLSDPSCTTDLFEMALAEGPLHALVNNAGVYLPLDYLNSDDATFEENWSRTFAINLESPARLMRSAARHFAHAGGGKILNVASRVGFKGEAGAASYAASKAALINLTRSLAVEMASKNVGFFCLAPGWVDTAMVRDGMNERLEAILGTLPLGRMASPDDCASAAEFLLSEDAAYLSGITIQINGASYLH